MSNNQSFVRKVTYIAIIAILLIPLSILSRPATSKKVGERFASVPGGVLANMRIDAGLSQARLGDIDPASEAMKLAMLGMRGIAVNFLWEQANTHKRKKSWDKLSATLEQIARLQPNFVYVWEFQAHNMSYNVSIEFDDYRQRYNWVKKGIDYLLEGITYNRDEPRLLWYAGWIVGQKLGRSDERVQFRRLYRNDEEFHTLLKKQGIPLDTAHGPDGKPDNWLSGRLWYLKAQDAVKAGRSLYGKSPAIFHSSAVMSRINYVSDMEREPDFDPDVVRTEWRTASEEWSRFGDMQLPTSAGFNVALNELEGLDEKSRQLYQELIELVPGGKEQVEDEKKKLLPEDFQKALDKPAAERTPVEQAKAVNAKSRIGATVYEVANRASPANLLSARKLAREINAIGDRERLMRSSRQIVNFEFWRARAQSGSTEKSTQARKLMFEANKLANVPDLEGAHAKYEESFRNWGEIFKQWPVLFDDADNADIIEAIESYIQMREQLDLRDPSGGILPHDFPLAELVKKRGRDDLLRFIPKRDDAKPVETKPVETKSVENKPENEKMTEEKPTEKNTEAKPEEKTEKPVTE